ncbi:hypothetical protein N7532_009698 [Penicillium argentinense]|uniref:ABC transporter domain-containing protein n=1 Tax=Penicillium argentinense TaxID=1131581 RepID=A0A9W9F005_9EURO|nr:uncharacterized protein N7532_009698 [Penicillium argentinense]KAJ5091014.1 hypothetical protein N7532_009698 [Penicillium argentinense]
MIIQTRTRSLETVRTKNIVMADASNNTCLSGGEAVPLASGFSCPEGFTALRTMNTGQEGSSYQTPLLALVLGVLLDILVCGICILFRSSSPSRKLSRYSCFNQPPPRLPVDEGERSNDAICLRRLDGLFPDNANGISLELTFTGINLRLGRPPRDILSDVHGTIQSGSVFASLVNILSGRSRPTQGDIAINGRPIQPDDLRSMIGFIPQHDIVPTDLTVRENILYPGHLLLGGRMPAHEIEGYVDSLISSLGLQHIRHQQAGALVKQGSRGISGGEYKRVSIALALAGAPAALVLDEPTSNLDATAAHSLVKLLHTISRRGIIVICVIHQPRVETFDLLGGLLVLNAGKQMYLGKVAEAQSVFEKLGHKFPLGSNPADVILDIFINNPPIGGGGPKGTLEVTQSPDVAVAEESVIKILQTLKERKISWLRQLWLAFQRSIIQQSRQTAGLVLEIGSSSIVGLMVGLSAFEPRGHLFQGLYHDPFDLLSSAVDYRTVVEQALLCFIAILCFRILLSSLHFTAFYLLLAAPMISLRLQLALVFLHYYCIYGLGFIVSALVRREDGGPPLYAPKPHHLSSERECAAAIDRARLASGVVLTWFSEAFLQGNIDPLAYLYDVGDAFAFTGYRAGRTVMDIGFLILIGTTYRLLSYTLFVLWGWKSQH